MIVYVYVCGRCVGASYFLSLVYFNYSIYLQTLFSILRNLFSQFYCNEMVLF